MSWLAHQVRSRPAATALRTVGAGARTLTYGELGELAGTAAARLARAGVAPETRVAVCLPNTVEHVVAIHAVTGMGAVLVPVDPRLDPGEIRRRLAEIDAAVLVTSDPSGELRDDPPCPVVPSSELTSSGSAPTLRPPATPRGPDELHSILFTSGSTGGATGRAGAIPLTHGNHLASATASAFHLGVDRRDDWLCCLPLVHVGGLAIVLRSVLYGTAVTLVDGFDPGRVAELFRSGRVTLASLVPTMLRRLLALDEPLGSDPERRPGLRAILLGGGPADPELIRAAWERPAGGLPVLATYGMTETASQVATVPPERLAEPDRRPGSAGQPLFGAEIEIRSESTGGTSPVGEIGEIRVRGPMVTPAAPAPRKDGEDGWLRTGDLGRFDEVGDLWVIGRRDEVIVTGGENVHPARVEAVLAAHPEVAACAVVGVDDPEWGRAVAAAVVPRTQGHSPEPAALAAWCRERLAPYEVPKRWRLVAELPLTAAGKVRRGGVKHLFRR